MEMTKQVLDFPPHHLCILLASQMTHSLFCALTAGRQGSIGVPPPVDLLSPEILTAIQEKAEIVATELKLAGLASIRGYVNTDTGSLTVLDVNTVPDLTTGSLIFKQVSTSFTEASRHYLRETLAFQSTRLERA